MSELKSQLMLNKEMSWVPCYLKSEADKVLARLKEQYKDMDITHTVHIAKMNARIEELEEAQRWRKFSEEKPERHQQILVCYKDYKTELRRWDDGLKFDVEIQEIYTHWMPLPKAPEDK